MFLVFFYPRGNLGVSNATFGLFIVNIQGLVFALSALVMFGTQKVLKKENNNNNNNKINNFLIIKIKKNFEEKMRD